MQAPRPAFPLPRNKGFLRLGGVLLSDVTSISPLIGPQGLATLKMASPQVALPCLGFHLSSDLNCPVCDVPCPFE